MGQRYYKCFCNSLKIRLNNSNRANSVSKISPRHSKSCVY